MGLLDNDRDLGGRELVEVQNDDEKGIAPVGVRFNDRDLGGRMLVEVPNGVARILDRWESLISIEILAVGS